MFIHNCNKKLSPFFPFIGLLIVFVLFHYTDLFFLKYYPVCMNFTLFLIFFISLFRSETVIQKIAKSMVKNIHQKELEYTRKLTVVWTFFCFINSIISLITVFLSDFVWYTYNGIISYILVGLLFGIEYIVRIRFKKQHGL